MSKYELAKIDAKLGRCIGEGKFAEAISLSQQYTQVLEGLY
jgi:hypothetical protein